MPEREERREGSSSRSNCGDHGCHLVEFYLASPNLPLSLNPQRSPGRWPPESAGGGSVVAGRPASLGARWHHGRGQGADEPRHAGCGPHALLLLPPAAPPFLRAVPRLSPRVCQAGGIHTPATFTRPRRRRRSSASRTPTAARSESARRASNGRRRSPSRRTQPRTREAARAFDGGDGGARRARRRRRRERGAARRRERLGARGRQLKWAGSAC